MSAFTSSGKQPLQYRLRLVDAYGVTGLGVVVALVLGIATLAAVIASATIFVGRAYGRTTCNNWGAQTGIRTKFVVLNWADGGTCLARTPDGRWVLNTKWQAFVNAGGKS